jgi:hypothetical protein
MFLAPTQKFGDGGRTWHVGQVVSDVRFTGAAGRADLGLNLDPRTTQSTFPS